MNSVDGRMRKGQRPLAKRVTKRKKEEKTLA
jgi:hypothetical protein